MTRTEVRGAWQRALSAGLNRDRPRWTDDLDGDALRTARERSGLAQAWPMLLHQLSSVTHLDGHLVFLSDADGRLLWKAGTGTARAAAERVHLVPGATWREDVVGPNGVGTVLSLGRPYQIRGREHYFRAVNAFTCSAAPIRDHAHGDILGVLDVTAPASAANALTLTVVAQAASLAEAQLRRDQLNRDIAVLDRFSDRVAWHAQRRVALVDANGRVLRASPPGWLPPLPAPVLTGAGHSPDGQLIDVEPLGAGGPYVVVGTAPQPATLRISIRNRVQAGVSLGDSTHVVSARHTELLRVLLSNPDGIGAKGLAEALYGDATKVSTVRGEISRLRRVLGNRLQAAPYRITGRLETDLEDLNQHR